MKMKINLVLVLLLAVFFGNAHAQLSTREGESNTLKFATRPKKGDKALFTSFTLKDSSLSSLKLYNVLRASDKLVFKYYLKDQLVLRAGAKVMRQSDKQNGNIADSSYYNPVVKPHLQTAKMAMATTEIVLKPGLEKHVKATNLIDVYGGADLLIGYGKVNASSNTQQTSGDYKDLLVVKNYGLVGAYVFTGFNVFVAKLPLSVGLEYGWSGLTTFANRNKVSVQEQIGSGTPTVQAYSATYYSNGTNVMGISDPNLYGKLNRRQANWGLNQTIRLTANFYFN